MELSLGERNLLIEENVDLLQLAGNVVLATITRRGFRAPKDRRENLREELVSAGRLVLVEAARDWRPEKKVPFRLFARKRLLLRVYECVRRRNLRELQVLQFNDKPHRPSKPMWAPDPQADLDLLGEFEMLATALEKLPVDQYAYIVMRFAGGKTVAEVAEAYGVSKNAVEIGTRAARETLRRELVAMVEAPRGRRSAA